MDGLRNISHKNLPLTKFYQGTEIHDKKKSALLRRIYHKIGWESWLTSVVPAPLDYIL